MSIYYYKEAEIGFNPKTSWAQNVVLKSGVYIGMIIIFFCM